MTKTKKKRTPPPKAKVEEAGDGIVLTRRFPAGSRVATPGALPPQVVRPIVCDSCGATGPKQYTHTGSISYYQCQVCVDPATMDLYVFKVIRG